MRNSAEYNRKYYEQNRERILQQMAENKKKYTVCKVCGAKLKKSSMTSHKTTKLHLYALAHPHATPFTAEAATATA